jgi:hypothetical protein
LNENAINCSFADAGKLMVNLIEQATALGVKDNVIWLDKFVPSEDLMMMFKCTSVYLTTFDESTPTSVGVQSP